MKQWPNRGPLGDDVDDDEFPVWTPIRDWDAVHWCIVILLVVMLSLPFWY